jgi:hypothetical protein
VHYSWTTRNLGRHRAVFAVLVLLMCLGRPLPANEVYKSVDADGHVVYSDHPDNPDAQKSVLHVEQRNPNEAARIAQEQAILKAEDAQRNRQKSVDDNKKAQQDHDKQVQCDSARSRYYAIKDARRLFENDADGNRVYYPDAQADAKKEDARQAMQTACGT